MTDRELEQFIATCLTTETGANGIDWLYTNLGDLVSRRTIQRRLDAMQRLGLITRIGKARATRYHLTPAGQSLASQSRRQMSPSADDHRLREDSPSASSSPTTSRLVQAASASAPGGTPASSSDFSTESGQLRDYLRQHHSLRKSCGYRRELLESYEPNQTWYLPANLRTKLREIGQTEHMAALPPGTYARQVMDRLIIDLSWNSSRLEGSTYSLLEIDHLLSLAKLDGSVRQKEAQMIINHRAAIEFLIETPDDLGFNRYTFFNLHALLSENLTKEKGAEGALRVKPVAISGTVYHPNNQPVVIAECFDLILQKAGAITDPLECSFFLMVHLPYLQPFMGGNRRTSRLAANIPLIKNNMSPLSFTDVGVRDYSEAILSVYELNRVEFLRDVYACAYERSARRYSDIREELGDPDPMGLSYRMEIKDCVREVVVQRMTKPAAAEYLRRWAAQNITASDRQHFIDIVEERLLALTEGSIVRVRVRPSEFHDWWPVWTGR